VLHFETPLRLQHNGRALPPDKLQARTLLMALTRRASLLAEFHADGPLASDFTALSAAAALISEEKSLTWLDWTRFSSRQKQKMSLGGVVGTWRLEGPLAPFTPLSCNSVNGCTSARKQASGSANTSWPGTARKTPLTASTKAATASAKCLKHKTLNL
jgi:hypothetical protein